MKTEKEYDITNPYDAAIMYNNRLGLTPKKQRLYLVGEGCYGVYDSYSMAKKDSEEYNCTINRDPYNNTYRAIQHCYLETWKKYQNKYVLKEITRGNMMYTLDPAPKTLFSKV